MEWKKINIKYCYFLRNLYYKLSKIFGDSKMSKEKILSEITNLYEKLERDKELYKEFIANEDKFLQDRGFEPSEVKEMLKNITKERMTTLKDVLEEQSKKIP